MITDPIVNMVTSISLFSLDTVTLPPMSQTTVDCVTAKLSPLATRTHEGWITTHDLPANRRGLFAEKGYQTLGEGKTRIAISNLSRETRTIHAGQTVAKFQKETESDEEVLVVNNLSLEEDVSCPMPDVNPFRDVDQEGHTDQISRAGTAEQVVTKRSCLRNRADSARPRDPGVRRERPSCEDRREAAGSAVGRNLTMGESGMIDDTEQRDVSAVVALNLESTAKEYEYGDRRRIQGTRVLSTDSQVLRKRKSGNA